MYSYRFAMLVVLSLAILSCHDGPARQQVAKVVYHVTGYQDDHRSLTQALRKYAEKRELTFLDGSGDRGKWGYLINIVIENGDETRIWATTGANQKRLLIRVFSDAPTEVWQSYAADLRELMNDKFGGVEELPIPKNDAEEPS